MPPINESPLAAVRLGVSVEQPVRRDASGRPVRVDGSTESSQVVATCGGLGNRASGGPMGGHVAQRDGSAMGGAGRVANNGVGVAG